MRKRNGERRVCGSVVIRAVCDLERVDKFIQVLKFQ